MAVATDGAVDAAGEAAGTGIVVAAGEVGLVAATEAGTGVAVATDGVGFITVEVIAGFVVAALKTETPLLRTALFVAVASLLLGF